MNGFEDIFKNVHFQSILVLFWVNFAPFWPNLIIFEKMTSLYETCYGILPSCKKNTKNGQTVQKI